MDIQAIKQRFGIIGHDTFLERAIHVAVQVAPTDLTVLITGESGTGKEVFPKIIHQSSARKHGPYIAVNCGAIPEGTIDSELFGHEKGSFTGAHEARKGYFEVVDGGTIFLDEVAELPLSTQVRLLRVLETGEFLKVGSSKVIKTDARVVAATNVNVPDAIQKGNSGRTSITALIQCPLPSPLHSRKQDIVMLFKNSHLILPKIPHASSATYDGCRKMLENFRWPGNIRQLKNVTEQISIIEKVKLVDAALLQNYLPKETSVSLPVLYRNDKDDDKISERDLLYKVLFDMKKDILELKKTVADIVQKGGVDTALQQSKAHMIRQFADDMDDDFSEIEIRMTEDQNGFQPSEVIDENLSLEKKEIDMIKRALEKHSGKRKNAAKELGISERTLYRKIKEHNIDL